MSEGKTGSRRRFRIGVAVAVAVIVACAAAAPFLEIVRGGQEGERWDLYSSLSPTPEGVKALYLLLGELGWDTGRLTGGIDAEALEDTDVLFVLQPVRSFDDAERAALDAWLDRGGTVVVAGFVASDWKGWRAEAVDPDDPFTYHDPRTGPEDGGESEAGGEGWTGREERRWEQTDEPESAVLLDGVEALGWKDVVSQKSHRFDVPGDSPAWTRGEHEVLVRQGGKSFVEVTRVGDGRVVKIREVAVVVNQSIRMEDNLVLVLNALDAWGGEGRVLFDEAHGQLAFDDQPGVWDVLGPAAEVAFLQLLAAVVLGLVAAGFRHAPPLPERRARRRRTLQQVEALAGMLQAAGAESLAVRILHRRTRRLWRIGRFSPPPGAGEKAHERQRRLYATLEGIAAAAGSSEEAGRRALVRYLGYHDRLRRSAERHQRRLQAPPRGERIP